jgi:hypothetical protein
MQIFDENDPGLDDGVIVISAVDETSDVPRLEKLLGNRTGLKRIEVRMPDAPDPDVLAAISDAADKFGLELRLTRHKPVAWGGIFHDPPVEQL